MDYLRYAAVILELALGLFLAWALTTYIFLAFWANQWVFNDVIAWSVLIAVGIIVSTAMYCLHNFVIRRYLLD